MSKHLDVKTFEEQHKNIKLLETIGDGSWQIELFVDCDTGKYYSKGPFARWDAICFVFLSKVKNEKDAKEWVEMIREKS